MEINNNKNIINSAYRNLYGNLYFKKNEKNKISSLFNKFLEIILRSKIYAVNIKRKIYRIFFLSKKREFKDIKIHTCLKKNSKLIKKRILSKGYIFLEDFLNQKFYQELKDNFPSKIFFQKSKNPFKNFDIGFYYLRNQRNPNLNNFHYLKIFYSFIKSKAFEKEVNLIFGLKEKRRLKCINIVSSLAEKKSFLAAHKDAISKDRNDLNLNFIYFIDGNDHDIEYSGGTSIYKNESSTINLLTPKTLKNSVLLYDNTKDFYHGFKMMKNNNYRKAITFQFNLI